MSIEQVIEKALQSSSSPIIERKHYGFRIYSDWYVSRSGYAQSRAVLNIDHWDFCFNGEVYASGTWNNDDELEATYHFEPMTECELKQLIESIQSGIVVSAMQAEVVEG